jgi:uncharacterized protein YbjT (DUF2867 family)
MTLETRPPQLTICVLGGTGFVGTELISHLAKDGHWIRVPTRPAADNDSLRVLDTVQLIGILNEEGRSKFKSVHMDLAEKVVTAARTAEVSRLLHMSSLAADATAAPSKYLRSKGEAEAKVRASAPSLKWTTFRPSVIFGPGDSLTNRFAGLLRLSGGFLPLARAGARFVRVGDVALAFRRAVRDRTTIGQTYELCGPEILTLNKWSAQPQPLPESAAQSYKLGIKPQPMLVVLPTYLGDQSATEQLDYFRRINDR